MIRKLATAAFAVAALIAAPAFAAEDQEFNETTVAVADGNIVIQAPWAVSLKDDELIVFMEIHNSAETDTINGVSTEIAKSAKLAKFEKTLRDAEEVDEVEAEGGKVTSLNQDGYHLQLTDLTDEVEDGDVVKLTLSFEETGDLEIEVSVAIVK